MTVDRWVAELAPRLPGTAGFALQELSYQSNYDEKGLTIPQLMQRLGKGQRTVETSMNLLVNLGHVLFYEETSTYFCAGVVQDLAQALRRNLRGKWLKKVGLDDKREVSYPWIKSPIERREGIEGSNKKKTPKTRNVTASAGEGQDVQAQSKKQDRPPSRLRSQSAKKASKTDSAQGTGNVPPAAAPTPFQELFGAVALVCYGGHEHLTASAKGRVGKATKSLLAADFQAQDIPAVVEWVRTAEAWRKGTLTPEQLEDRAAAWRGVQKGSLMTAEVKPHVLKFTPRPRTTQEANERLVANMAANADAVRGVFDE